MKFKEFRRLVYLASLKERGPRTARKLQYDVYEESFWRMQGYGLPTIDTVQRDLNAMVREGVLVRQRDPDGKHTGHDCDPATCRVTLTRYALADRLEDGDDGH